MTTTSSTTVSTTAALLHRAATRAMRAPSIHNTQPWRFVLTRDALEIHGDRSRRLPVLDPRGRQMMISLGCALFHARVAIAAAGYEPIVRRLPDSAHPDLIARISIGQESHWPGSFALDLAIDHRRTNRRAFSGEPVPSKVLTDLEHAARIEGALLFPVVSAEHRQVVTELSALADHAERSDPAYVNEIAQWTTDDPRRSDGVQAASVPYAHDGCLEGQVDPLPIRSFDVRGMGWLPAASGSDGNQCLLLFCTHEDNARGWLRIGEALEHVWLKLTEQGLWASPLTQVIEVSRTHDRLRAELGLAAHPQVLLRVGRAPETVPTRRRPPNEVIVHAGVPDER
jgi:hypothetical protein